MKDLYVYQFEQNNILYLTEYKQAYCISDEEYKKIVEDSEENILMEYVKKNCKCTHNSFTNIKNDRYELYLCVSNCCNAKCTYCFANQGDYGKQQGVMRIDVAESSIDAFMKYVPKENDVIINFFGGEPLLAYDTIVHTCKYLEENYATRKIEYHITTNGTLLNKEIIDFLAEKDFRVVVSIDGGAAVQNSQRPLSDGRDSYLEVTKNLKYLLENVKYVLARGTYCNKNFTLKECYDDLIKLGFKEVNIVPDFIDMTDHDEKKLIEELEGLFQYIRVYISSNKDFPFGLFKMRIRELFLPVKPVVASCGAGNTILSIDINGDIYPCHRHSSDTSLKMGTIYEKIKKRRIDETYDATKCKKCWNRYTCTHGCSFENKQLTGEMKNKSSFFCEYSKKMTELAVNLCFVMNDEQLKDLIFKSCWEK